jgi:hypothetical protein
MQNRPRIFQDQGGSRRRKKVIFASKLTESGVEFFDFMLFSDICSRAVLREDCVGSKADTVLG